MGNTGSLRRGSTVLQDASDLARFERVRSGDKGQGEPSVLKWPQAFYRNLVFLSEDTFKNPRKSSLQPRNVHDFDQNRVI